MRIKKYRYFVGDFETTTYKNQVHTEVWASALVELFDDKVEILHSIDETFNYLRSLKTNVIVYYHNLKFDGSFWLPFLINVLKLKQAKDNFTDDEDLNFSWLSERHMENNTFKYVISSMGSWYTIIIKVNGKFIEIRDSLKLLPFSVKKIGKSFGTKHKKLDMEYKGFRYAGCEITPQERTYIENDVLVVKEALEIMHEQKHDKMTIGSCCLSEYKNIIGEDDYKTLFPVMKDIELDATTYGKSTAEEYIRNSYKGGWCYLVKGKANKIYKDGTTADWNSLYPSVMSSQSGNRYPIGNPVFWSGDYIHPKAIAPNKYYFVRIKTRFYLKKDKLPFIQIKRNYRYKGNECLESSDIQDTNGNYHTHYKGTDGLLHDTRVELTLTMTDYKLFLEHYDVVEFEILDGCWFFSEIGIFDEYIEKYKRIKTTSEGAIRELAKLFLNNLYGKMASSDDSSFKYAYDKGNGVIGFKTIHANEKDTGFIPVGSAITSYARNATIRGAQANYHGVNERGFIYADTDSIHCDLQPEELIDIAVHPTEFCHWSLESKWDEAIFTRQKTYIEHITHEGKLEGLVKVDKPYYDIKCAGMPQRCKDFFNFSLVQADEKTLKEYCKDDKEMFEYAKEVVAEKYTLLDFNVGLALKGKLMPKRISGGIVLLDTTYKMN